MPNFGNDFIPSYLDDVLEYVNLIQFPTIGETGKIYVALDTNIVYRWSGSIYVEISSSLALGENSSTAYRGDRGKVAYDHSQIVYGNPHGTTKAHVGLPNVDNTRDIDKAISALQQTALDLKQNNITPGATSQYYRGDKSFQDLPTAIRASILTGLVTNVAGTIQATQDILANFGFTQYQINSILSTITTLNTTIALKANLFSPTFSGTPLAPTPATNDNSTQIATTQFVNNQLLATMAALDVAIFKGVIDASTNPNYPAGDNGNIYRISSAGKIGGASGKNVEAGDMLICLVDGSSSGTQASVGANWNITQVNIDGAVITADTSSSDNDFIVLSGLSGKIIKKITQAGFKALLALVKADVGLANVPNIDTTNASNISTGTLPDTRLSANIVTVGSENTLTNKNLSDSTTAIVDSLDQTKKIMFIVNNTTGCTTSFQTNSQTNQIINFPNGAGTLALTTDILPKPLTGLSLATATDVTAADTVLIAFGKLQAQLNNKQSFKVTLGTSSTSLKKFTITFPVAFSNYPTVVVTARTETGQTFSDVFACTVQVILFGSFVVSVQRVDANAAWSQSLELFVVAML